ncbi:putative ubiquitin-specific protease [Saccharomycopsis crataegensis]|uniref:ubiquitinyl hydrolase 1 n=1 Tax=Saccharomycopsis crataegensis TaxID=43959 RepID=A0AAV5QUT0_9ASCO|nr:putative ubiquitin-specific protease [Saccharomycopsis crataegensis]
MAFKRLIGTKPTSHVHAQDNHSNAKEPNNSFPTRSIPQIHDTSNDQKDLYTLMGDMSPPKSGFFSKTRLNSFSKKNGNSKHVNINGLADETKAPKDQLIASNPIDDDRTKMPAHRGSEAAVEDDLHNNLVNGLSGLSLSEKYREMYDENESAVEFTDAINSEGNWENQNMVGIDIENEENSVTSFDADHIKKTFGSASLGIGDANALVFNPTDYNNDQASRKTTSTTTSVATTAIPFPESVTNDTNNVNGINLENIGGESKSANKPERENPKTLSEPFVPNSSPKIQRFEPNGVEEINFDLPFGDGSMKIYGMENFGASCYCNSIVQSLYYTPLFRKYILSLPSELNDEILKDERIRKTEMPGSKTHHFTAAVKNNKIDSETGDLVDKAKDANNNGNSNSNDNNKDKHESQNNSDGTKIGRRMSFFGKKDKSKDDRSSNNTSRNNSISVNSNNDDNSNQPVNSVTSSTLYTLAHDGHLQSGETIIYRSKSNIPGLKDLKLGFEVSNRNVTVVGVVDDPNATAEQRKRRALIDGPILNLDSSLTANHSETMFDALKDIFECMVENSSQIGVVSPMHLVEVLKKENELFRSMMHQDAHEFFNYLLNSVFEQIDVYYEKKKEQLQKLKVDKKTYDAQASILNKEMKFSSELFEGLLTSQTKCLRCERISSRDEKFLDLSIDTEHNSSVTACLKQFSKKEILCEDNKFYCEYCSSLQEATKRMVVKKLPKILTLHLKRFKYSEKLNRNTKLFHRVSYPLYLRLFNTLDTEDANTDDKIYELYSVVVHIGGGPYHGHYVSCVKTEHSGWLLFDDETVESIDENFVLKFFGDGPGLASAYILLYKEITEEEYLKKTLFQDLCLELEDELAEEMNYQNTREFKNGNSYAHNHSKSRTGSTSSNSRPPSSRGSNNKDTGIIHEEKIIGNFKIPDLSKRKESITETPETEYPGPIRPINIPKKKSFGAISPLSPGTIIHNSSSTGKEEETQSKSFKRTKSISLKSPIHASFKFGSLNGISNGDANKGRESNDTSTASTSTNESQNADAITSELKDGDAPNDKAPEDEVPKTKRKSIFGFNKKPKSKK